MLLYVALGGGRIATVREGGRRSAAHAMAAKGSRCIT